MFEVFLGVDNLVSLLLGGCSTLCLSLSILGPSQVWQLWGPRVSIKCGVCGVPVRELFYLSVGSQRNRGGLEGKLERAAGKN